MQVYQDKFHMKNHFVIILKKTPTNPTNPNGIAFFVVIEYY